ncbi:MAG: NAD-dependent epimerase/dehydratase family protein, partial [Bacteroidota bacterium]|nr:NAD-dependent epimerase/dehydratase family protein [Bacteroidota bacterium]
AGEGQHIVIVNPTRVYGPGLLSESNGVTRMVKLYLEGKWHFIPGNGISIGNYVFVDDVVQGHILAMENGRIGENYILGGENINYLDFFDRIRDISGDRFSLFNVGLKFMMLVSNCMKFMAEKFSISPAITPELVKKFTCNWNVSSNKAITELGYSITPLDEGLRRTINWLKSQ